MPPLKPNVCLIDGMVAIFMGTVYHRLSFDEADRHASEVATTSAQGRELNRLAMLADAEDQP